MGKIIRQHISILVLLTLASCSGSNISNDDNIANVDAGSTDTNSADTGSTDTGSADTGSADTGSTDTGSTDTGSTDTGSPDYGSVEQRELDNEKYERTDIALPSLLTNTVEIKSTPSGVTSNLQSISRVQEKVVANVVTDTWIDNPIINVYFEFTDESRLRFNEWCYFYDGNCRNARFRPDPLCSSRMTNDTCEATIVARIIDWANDWSITSSVSFRQTNNESQADIRVGFMDICDGKNCGSWAGLGRSSQQQLVDQRLTSMNFDWLTKSVVLHEFGHALGLAHEQSHPDFPLTWNTDVAVSYYKRLNEGWTDQRALSQLTHRTNGVFSSFGTYDAFSIMHYSIPKYNNIGGASLIENLESCPSASDYWCVSPTNELSSADRTGIASLYPTAATSYNDIEIGNATFVEYSPNIDNRTHLLLFNTLPQAQQDMALSGNANVVFTVKYISEERDRTCRNFAGITSGHNRLEAENYRLTMNFVSTSLNDTKTISFTVRGNLEQGCGFQSNSSRHFGSAAAISAAITKSLR